MPFTTLLPSPRQRFYTNTGTPAAFHKLYTYDAGTTTNKAAYQDAAGTVPHENPITLDAKGEALIYFAIGAYKIDLKDPLGLQITGYPVDNVVVRDPSLGIESLRDELALPGGSAELGFLQAVPGAIPRTGQDKLREIMTFRDFGVTGNGIDDDWANMQKAIDYAGSVPNAELRGSSGDKYRISKGLVVKFDGKFQDPTSALTIDFTGTRIIPGADNIVCVKAARDFVTIIRPTIVNADGRPGITSVGVMPEDPAQSVTQVSQQFCVIVNPVCYGVDVGIKQMPGPTVSGQASGAFYNTYDNPIARNTKCGIWLAGSANALDVLNTRTTINNPIHVGGNCSFWAEAADTANVEGGSSENITSGTWPCATPTTIFVPREYLGHTLDNNTVRFNGFVAETGQIPYNIDAFYCSLTNCDFIGYTLPPVGDHNRTSWANKGSVTSESTNAGAMALLVARAAGKQAYLGLAGSGTAKAEFYSDNSFKFASPVEIADLRSSAAGGQLMGGGGQTLSVGGSGQVISLYNLSSSGAGVFSLGGCVSVRSDTDNLCALGTAANRWGVVYAGTGAINTSDETAKQQIQDVDAAALRAFARIGFKQFKFNDAVADKGDSARLHFGVIAQQVKAAFEAEGLDPFSYGVLCYDEWPDQYEPVIAERETTTELGMVISEKYETGEMKLVKEAGSRYGVRHDELYALGFAYLLKCINPTKKSRASNY